VTFSPIPGIGPPNAKIMLVGEAPGKDEDLLEEPFVGKCGKFLDRCLIEPAGLRRDELYITNVVKCMCRDGNKNRKPKREEVWSCEDWLVKEIQLINPKIIITLGDTAFKWFTEQIKPKMKLSESIGKYIPYSGRIIIPCYHPSYLQNYSRSKTEESLNVFKRAKELAYD